MKDNKAEKRLWIRLAPLLGGLLGIALALFLVTTLWVSAPATPAKAACDDGFMYGVARTDPTGGTSGAIYQFDSSGVYTHVIDMPYFQSDAVARDPKNCNMLYILDNNYSTGSLGKHTLYKYEINSTEAPVPVNGELGNTNISIQEKNFDRLDFTPDGTLYGLFENRIYRFNVDTGEATHVGTIPSVWGTSDGGDITFDINGVLWAVRQRNFYRIDGYDTSSPQATLLCDNVVDGNMPGIGINEKGYFQVFEWYEGTYRFGVITYNQNTGTCSANWEGSGFEDAPNTGVYISDMTSTQTSTPPNAIVLREMGARAIGIIPVPVLAGLFVAFLVGSALFLYKRSA